MAIGETDVFEVVVLAAGADAFLASGGCLVVALLKPEENVFELIHASIGKEQRGVVRGDERGAAYDLVIALLKESQECFADFVASQVSLRDFIFIIADESESRNAKGCRRKKSEGFGAREQRNL
jgi:hypothetical protein